MLLNEHFRQQQQNSHPFHFEDESADSYQGPTMEYNYTTAFNNNIGFDFVDLMPANMDPIVGNFAFDMVRTPSNVSMERSSHEYPPALLSSTSVGSASSSTVGSPYSGHTHMATAQESYTLASHALPEIYTDDGFQHDYVSSDLSFADKMTRPDTSVDPSWLSDSRDALFTQHQYGSSTGYPQPAYSNSYNSSAPSPVPSQHSYAAYNPVVPAGNYNSVHNEMTRGTSPSQRSVGSPRTSVSGDEEGGEKGRCPHPDCGRIIKDLKAHMLTHQTERPEKCPITTCDYHIKGFARKYDKNRHTLTHYKGTMVCGFCPHSGSPAEKSFNRADVFKRHLIKVHGVEQNPPNSRKRSPSSSKKELSSYCQDATGKCSTCSATFNNAQEFYEHLDDCVLRVVQEEEPSEAINEHWLRDISADPAVQETFDRNHIKQEEVIESLEFEDEEEEEEEEDEYEYTNDRCGKGVVRIAKPPGARAVIGSNITKHRATKKGMTWSKIGVPLTVGKGRKRRKHYPPSWGMDADNMKMKKRVLCVYNGPHRLLKDDMMLDNEFEVRMRLNEGNRYVTDLDVETLNRAQAFHDAPEEERASWIVEQDLLI